MKKQAHVISHSHWDREWYLPYEKHHMLEVEFMDKLLDTLERDPEFKSFHLDGQTIMLDDYLQVRPERRELVERLVKEKRLYIGPWYILQDEWLTGSESNLRNLETGMREAKGYGNVSRVGYFPDSFGNMGQAPQILLDAGIDCAVFGRGVKPTGFNNEVSDGADFASRYSEMFWESPDGSRILGVLFANWYSNGIEIPTDPGEAKKYWEKKLADAMKFASTDHLLFMNGCDHQPVQTDLTDALKTAAKLYPDIDFVHSDFTGYMECLKQELKEDLAVIRGELRSQETDGWYTLANTASSRIYLKQMNARCEALFTRAAEPLAAMAHDRGMEYPHHLFDYGWKTLMQNHPHDSICGCSVDEVNEEMKTRFAKSRQVADAIYDESVEYLTNKVNTAALPGDGEKIPFVVWNTSGETKSQVVEKELHLFRDYNLFVWDGYEAAEKVELPAMVLRDADGNVVPAKIADAGVAFGYDLPDDRFRQPYMAKKVLVTFEAEVPALGYRTYYLETAEQAQDVDVVSADENVLENDAVKVVVNADGSYNLLDKKTGRMYENLGFYEDTGDMGNEYIYIQDSGKQVVSTKGMKAEISCVEKNAFRTVVEICHKMMVPSGMGEELLRQREMCIDPYMRVANRSSELVEMDVKTVLTLEKSAKGLRVATTICNQAKDHRVRVILPAGLDTSMHMADSAFEVVRRNNRHNDTWTNPCGCERQQCFVAMEDAKGGLLVANRGLYEYEILEDQGNAVAVTLLRCVAEMGDWGYFPTPKAQQIGTFCLEFEVVPFAAGETGDAFREGYAFQEDLTVEQAGLERAFLRKPGQVKPELVEGELPLEMSFLAFEGDGIHMTAFKKGQKKDDLFVRFVNNMEHEEVLSFKKEDWMKEVYRSNVIEEKGDLMIPDKDGVYHVALREFEIATFGIVK